MNWSGWSEFFAMGGHALYVWGAYLGALGILVIEVILLLLRSRNIRQFLGAARWQRGLRSRP